MGGSGSEEAMETGRDDARSRTWALAYEVVQQISEEGATAGWKAEEIARMLLGFSDGEEIVEQMVLSCTKDEVLQELEHVVIDEANSGAVESKAEEIARMLLSCSNGEEILQRLVRSCTKDEKLQDGQIQELDLGHGSSLNEFFSGSEQMLLSCCEDEEVQELEPTVLDGEIWKLDSLKQESEEMKQKYQEMKQGGLKEFLLLTAFKFREMRTKELELEVQVLKAKLVKKKEKREIFKKKSEDELRKLFELMQ